MLTTHHKNLAAFIHLSTFSKFFIPFGNFILPLLLWTMNKDKSDFVDTHGKQAINFQLSVLLYAIAALIIIIPLFLYVFAGSFPNEFQINNHHSIHINGEDIHNLSGFFIIAILAALVVSTAFIVEIVLVIIAIMKANNGELYNYPLTINFIK